MEFHLWDFSKHIEVRLNQEYIEKIRSMTVAKKVRVQDRNRDYLVTRNVKVIAFRQGHPYHKIAERLYAKTDWHGDGRNRVPHKPFISVLEFMKVHDVTGLPLDEMERNVIEVRNHWAGHVDFPMRFPVLANEDWAWLLGFWYSSGGKITRHRIGKDNYPSDELSLRFQVDRRVYEEKVKPILQRIGYEPGLRQVWYVKRGLNHPLDRNRRKGIGNTPKEFFILLRPIREIMEKFGIPKEEEEIRQDKQGRKYSSRRKLNVPDWLNEKESFSHAFIEGFLNGGQVGSDFSPRMKDKERGFLRRTAELRFASFDRVECQAFLNFFKEELGKRGITGYVHVGLHRKTSNAYWLGFLIHSSKCLSRIFEIFDVRRPDLRARLALNYFMNGLLYEACKELNSSEILVLGGLIEKPMSEEAIQSDFRFTKLNVQMALQKLEKLKIAREVEGVWRVRPTSYRSNLIRKLWKAEMKRRQKILASNEKFFSRCNLCGNLIDHNFQGSCGCGGKYEPLSRIQALQKLKPGYLSKIREILREEIPSDINQKEVFGYAK